MRAGLAAQARPPQRQPFFLIRPPEALGALFCLLATRLQGRRALGAPQRPNATVPRHATPRHAASTVAALTSRIKRIHLNLFRPKI